MESDSIESAISIRKRLGRHFFFKRRIILGIFQWNMHFLLGINLTVEIERVDDFGYTPLIAAASSGYLEITKRLIKAGAEIDRINEWDFNALMGASWKGHLDIVQELIKAGADTNLHSKKLLQTPLMYASRSGNPPLVQELIKAGAKIHDADYEGKTALCTALIHQPEEVVSYLIQQGANINAIFSGNYKETFKNSNHLITFFRSICTAINSRK